MECTNLITPRFQNFLTIGIMIVAWGFIATMGGQLFRHLGQNAGS